MAIKSIFTKDMSYPANSFVGSNGELFFDSSDGVLRRSDGYTIGGKPINVGNSIIITSVSDFPEPVNGVITLNDNTEYFIRGTVDLNNSKIICGNNQVFRGVSTEDSYLIANIADDAMIKSNSSIIADSLTFKNTGTNSECFNAHSSTGNDIITFKDVNIIDSKKAGSFTDYRNTLFILHAHINCEDGWSFYGTTRSIVIDTTATINNSTAGYIFCDLGANSVIQSRLRSVFSNFIISSGTTCFKIDAGASIPSEGFQLINCQFSGAGTYIDGIDQSNNSTWWVLNGNLRDTSAFGHIISEGSPVATTIGSQNEWTKATANTQVHMNHIERFSHSENQLTYTGAKERSFMINGTCSITGTTGDIVRVGVTTNGNTTDGFITYSKVSMPTGGRYDIVGIVSHARLVTNDYLEIYVLNESAARNVTVSDINLIVSEIGV